MSQTHPPVRLRALEPRDVPALTEMVNLPGVIRDTLQRPFLPSARRAMRPITRSSGSRRSMPRTV